MKKITLSVALLATMLTAKAQDTICTMVKADEVIEFEYKTSEIIDREDYKGIVFIEVGYREVLCLHLYDKKKRARKNLYQAMRLVTSYTFRTDRTISEIINPLITINTINEEFTLKYTKKFSSRNKSLLWT